MCNGNTAYFSGFFLLSCSPAGLLLKYSKSHDCSSGHVGQRTICSMTHEIRCQANRSAGLRRGPELEPTADLGLLLAGGCLSPPREPVTQTNPTNEGPSRAGAVVRAPVGSQALALLFPQSEPCEPRPPSGPCAEACRALSRFLRSGANPRGSQA